LGTVRLVVSLPVAEDTARAVWVVGARFERVPWIACMTMGCFGRRYG
jgi:hypothetical protein